MDFYCFQFFIRYIITGTYFLKSIFFNKLFQGYHFTFSAVAFGRRVASFWGHVPLLVFMPVWAHAAVHLILHTAGLHQELLNRHSRLPHSLLIIALPFIHIIACIMRVGNGWFINAAVHAVRSVQAAAFNLPEPFTRWMIAHCTLK